ncbi:hypothetical protein Z968_12050, partial [Clostridium novyi A str. 4552]
DFRENKNFDKQWEETFTQIINEIDKTQAKLTEINSSNITESVDKYVKSLELKLTQLYPMLNNNSSNTNFNNSKYSTNEEYNNTYNENYIN